MEKYGSIKKNNCFQANLIVENNRCVRRIIGFGILKKWEFYVDALSLMIPLLNIIDYDRRYQLAKLLRLKWFIDFEYHFCQGFKVSRCYLHYWSLKDVL